MKVFDCPQGSEEWIQLRHGRPTGSSVDKIITPKTRKPSTQATAYRAQLLAEWYVGHAIDWGGSSSFMDRGTGMELEAVRYYEMIRDVEVARVGFVTCDDGRFGGSPDGLIGARGGLETKCPALHTHIGYLTDPSALVDAYNSQVQSYMLITGREWFDLFAYNPELPEVIVRVERDEQYIDALDEALDRFLDELDAGKRTLLSLPGFRAPAGAVMPPELAPV